MGGQKGASLEAARYVRKGRQLPKNWLSARKAAQFLSVRSAMSNIDLLAPTLMPCFFSRSPPPWKLYTGTRVAPTMIVSNPRVDLGPSPACTS